MSEVFSQYVTLVDEIEQIPIMARESRTLSPEQRTAVMAQVVALVRDRVLPQSDRDCASREALLDDEDASDRAAAGRGGGAPPHPPPAPPPPAPPPPPPP